MERFQAALECLAFLGDSLPPELLDRALVVRTVGGEDLELVRAVLAGDHGASLEHACLARVQAVEMALALPDSATSYRLLARALRHPSPAVKLTALHGLGLLGDSRAAPAVRRLAADPDSPLSADARRCLALLSSRTSEDVVLLRPSAPASASSDALLRPAYTAADDAAHELLRPSR